MAQSVELETTVEVETAASTKVEEQSRASFFEWSVVLTLAALVLVSFGLRAKGISRVGFAEDEINKVDAVRAYEHVDITPNAEHPMLMKALIFVSLETAHAVNAGLSAAEQISDEAAVRLPNLLFGALTVIPLFFLTAAFFDRATALTACALWAFGINAITYNRIAKEDTLLIFFMLFAFYFYLRAKQTSGFDARGKRRNYLLSGASFGLMMASKYFPHYFGLNVFYHHLFRVRERQANEPKWKTPGYFFLAMLIVFLLANPIVFLPQTWEYMQHYTSEQLQTHNGYLFAGHLYKNRVSATPFGTPLYFYFIFLAVKMPPPVIIALLIGFIVSLKRWRQPNYAFLLFMLFFWLVPYSLSGAKWLRYTLQLMPFIYMTASVGIIETLRLCASVFKRSNTTHALRFTSAVILIFFLAFPAWTAYKNSPHYAAYTNIIGGGRTGYFFPHDEFYDDGLREAIKFISDTAPQSATVAGETPATLCYYLEKYGRTDIRSAVLSSPDFKLADAPAPLYVIVLQGRTYFENQEKFAVVRSNFKKIYDVTVNGASAVEVYAR